MLSKQINIQKLIELILFIYLFSIIIEFKIVDQNNEKK